MKGFGFLCLLLLTGIAAAASVCTGCFSGKGSNADETLIAKNRKLKDLVDEDGAGGSVHLEDYRPINPVPSSKASIRPGTIHHGTPLMPYIPKHCPPPAKAEPPKRGHGG